MISCGSEQNVNQDFFDKLSQHCGNAYQGALAFQAPGFDLLNGEELLIAHFRECDETTLKIPFHIEKEDGDWDRSRTWILTNHGNRLELRHDHRLADGTDDDFTMYGGFSYGENKANMHQFQSVERSEETGEYRGWRLEIYPGERYVYGTVRDTNWTWRIEFDLSKPLDEVPPAPWGHE